MATSITAVRNSIEGMKEKNPSYATALDKCLLDVENMILAGNLALKAEQKKAQATPQASPFNAAIKNALPSKMQAYYSLLFQIYPNGLTEPGLVEIVEFVFSEAEKNGYITYQMQTSAVATASGRL